MEETIKDLRRQLKQMEKQNLENTEMIFMKSLVDNERD